MPNISWEQYGIAGAVICVLFFILWRILIWVMKWVDTQAKQHNEERIAWLATLSNLNKSIELHNQGSIEARKSAEEAHKYQREEHEKLAEQNQEICKALGRINGYKDD
ncbi:MAG: hypothetical protein WC478_01160 [Candidatus Omnitrophota bacterium]